MVTAIYQKILNRLRSTSVLFSFSSLPANQQPRRRPGKSLNRRKKSRFSVCTGINISGVTVSTSSSIPRLWIWPLAWKPDFSRSRPNAKKRLKPKKSIRFCISGGRLAPLCQRFYWRGIVIVGITFWSDVFHSPWGGSTKGILALSALFCRLMSPVHKITTAEGSYLCSSRIDATSLSSLLLGSSHESV